MKKTTQDPDKGLEERLVFLLEKARLVPLPLREIVEILSGKGQPLILILLCLPFCQPLQIPGMSIPFGIVIAFLGLRMAFGRHAWLPKKALSAKISYSTLKKMTTAALWFIRKARVFLKRRWDWMYGSVAMKRVNGVMIAVLGIFLALPLPIPLTNVITAWAIFLISLGLLEDDGLFVFLGYAVAVCALIVLIVLIVEAKNLFIFINNL